MVKYLVMDVDGSLTDGKIYMGITGESQKAFSVKDGYAINNILKHEKIEPIIITARQSQIVLNRCNELGIEKIYQGKTDKISVLKEIVGQQNMGDCAYFGDDILDLQCMSLIKEAGGIVGCPSDAVKEVKFIANYICDNKAGEGALREFVEWLVKPKLNPKEIKERVQNALLHIESLDYKNLNPGKYVVNDMFYYIVQEYYTKDEAECELESHRKYIDIQWIVDGYEAIDIANIAELCVKGNYDEIRDVEFFKKTTHMARVVMGKNSYVVLYPENAHMPGLKCQESVKVKKIVGKVKIVP